MPSATMSVVTTRSLAGGTSSRAASSRRLNAPSPASGRKKRSMIESSSGGTVSVSAGGRARELLGAGITCDTIEHAVHQSRFVGGEEGVRDIDIFRNDDAARNVAALQQLEHAAAEDC